MKTLTDGPADAVDLATGAVELGWRVTVVNPDPDHYTLRLAYGHPDEGVTVLAHWFGDHFQTGAVFWPNVKAGRHDETSLDTIRRLIEDRGRRA